MDRLLPRKIYTTGIHNSSKYLNNEMFKCLNVKMNKGFTIIEMLVVITIFSIVIGSATGVFIWAIRLQRYNLAYQQILNQTSYAMEYMSRAIRMAKKDLDGSCINWNTNYEIIGGGSGIKFENYNLQCQEFSLVGEQLVVKFDGGSAIPLTSTDFNVASLKFEITGETQPPGDTNQPRATIFMEVEGKNLSPLPRIKIQTTISQRDLDTEK